MGTSTEPRASPSPARPVLHDFRVPALGATAWLGAVVAAQSSFAAWTTLAVALGAAAAGLGGGWRSRRLSGARRFLLAAALLLAAVVIATLLRHHAVAVSPLREFAAERATADLVATVVSDPRSVEGQWGDQVVVRLRVHEVDVRGQRYRLGGSVVLLGHLDWADVALGERVVAEGRLAPTDDPEQAALLTGARAPTRLREPDVWWRASAAVRASIRHAVAHRPPDQAGLVPALVDGDDAALPADLEADFRTTGLTHLTAVSGTNLTLVVVALLGCARAIGVRRRWLLLVGLLGIAGFILLARTEPSVMRAAAMGVVGMFAFGPDGRRRGLRALGVAVLALVIIQPPLAVSVGFALSVLATAGIVLLGPPLTERLARWLPHGLAEAIAIPTAAQLACTPLIAVISGQVSLVAVLANLLVEPAVGPATVLGLLAGLVGLVWDRLGQVFGTGAAWCVAWIIAVARWGADLPGAAIGWGTGALAVTLLVGLCLAIAIALPVLAARRGLAVGLGVLLVVVLLGAPGRPWSLPAFGWPPEGWVVVACDVGQGDAHVLRTGPGSAVVVDAGPDPQVVDGCLRRLGIRRIPLLVLTHFHADHVDGLAGVLDGREVGAVEVSPVLDPPSGAASVQAVAARARVPISVVSFAQARRYGELTVQVLHPDLPVPAEQAGAAVSANDASVVLLVEVAGIRILLTGDVEPPGQSDLARLLPGLDIDVLKVPHHGSRHQDYAWLAGLRPEVALVSVGADNDYGHPAPKVLRALDQVGARVLRTDQAGDVAVVVEASGTITTAARH